MNNGTNLKWLQGKDVFGGSGGWRLYAGRWLVGSVYYGSAPRSDKENWVAACRLPGIKEVLGKFADVEDAKRKVEQGVRVWFSRLSDPPRPEGVQSKEAP